MPKDEAPRHLYIRSAQHFAELPSRRRPLPPGANAAATACVLYQLKEHIEYRCARCRRDRIADDCIAVDAAADVLMCKNCFARAVRPREYAPTRLVPFASLLSWLQHKGSGAAAPSTLATERPAEAMVPSAQRAAGAAAGWGAGDAIRAITALPPTPLQMQQHHEPVQAQVAAVSASTAAASERTHPCADVFGHACQHGVTCFFARAPADLCLAYLMGIPHDASVCHRRHEAALQLPATDPCPARDSADFAAWLERRTASSNPNRAEWQLWAQRGAMMLLDAYHPQPTPVPTVPTGLSALAIQKALAALRK